MNQYFKNIDISTSLERIKVRIWLVMTPVQELLDNTSYTGLYFRTMKLLIIWINVLC